MRLLPVSVLGLGMLAIAATAAAQVSTPNPIMFVTQFPIPVDFGTIGSVFNNHRANMDLVGRGGDLYVRYGNGTLRNLTREGGYGLDDVMQQGASAIAVRDPSVHWSGRKAVFSMVVGAPTRQHQVSSYWWQLYEISGFGEGEQVTIRRVPNQPPDYNNIMPVYDSAGNIIFVSDRPRNGARHLYPQQDEYESAPTNTGLWSLSHSTGELSLLQHSPSGSFDPFVDSFGRIVFSRWDHLLRDQQNDAGTFGTFNYSSEAIDSVATTRRDEVFPEPRINGEGINRFVINHFFPWQINQDGTGEETLNHLGRHELHKFFTRSFTNDPNLSDFEVALSSRPSRNEALNFLQLHEDSGSPGTYYAIAAPEFGTHNAGQILRLHAPPSANADDIDIEYVTHLATRSTSDVPQNSGHYRNPIVLSDGRLVSSHAGFRGVAGNDGTTAAPVPRYHFRLRTVDRAADGTYAAAQDLTTGIARHVRYWSPGVLVEYQGPMWELSPVEVVARAVPAQSSASTALPEQTAYQMAGVSEEAFRDYLRAEGLAVLVMRDVTTRDDADEQQPYNLRVAGGGRQTPLSPVGRVYDIAHMQMVQADQIRGRAGHAGRRVLAQMMHDEGATQANRFQSANPPGSVPIYPDGSVAVFVPARRALAWQATAEDGTPVVRERYWLTFQPGEVRACDGCHGVNKLGHGNEPASRQTAEAFVELLVRWKGAVFASGFEVK